jgi:hypothetical protein
VTGPISFTYISNNGDNKIEEISAKFTIGETKKKPKDWIEGEITVNG